MYGNTFNVGLKIRPDRYDSKKTYLFSLIFCLRYQHQIQITHRAEGDMKFCMNFPHEFSASVHRRFGTSLPQADIRGRS